MLPGLISVILSSTIITGFGYDPIVYLPEYGKTSGELAPEEKNKISHRGKALALIKEELDKSEELYAEDNDSK